VERGRGIKVSFLGGISFGRAGSPERTDDGVILTASMADLLATRLEVMLRRAEAKDYRDVATILRSGASLAHGLAAAVASFGHAFQPSESLRALVFFRDGDLASLSALEKATLVNASKVVRELPEVRVLSRCLGADRTRRMSGPGLGG